MLKELWKKIQRRLLKLRLKPIRVFCFHQVSDTFDESTMKECDWLQTDAFKRIINDMQQNGYEFISLPEAHEKIRNDRFRSMKYAVLTADDGWASMKNILPWLNEQQIPITLFLNPGYLDGKLFREIETEKYLNEDEVKHVDATKQTEEEFKESLKQSMRYLRELPNYVSYFAYTWGRHTRATDAYLQLQGIVPIYMNGKMNYNNQDVIHRELL